MSFGPMTITIIRAGAGTTRDDYNNVLPGEDIYQVVAGCSVQPAAGRGQGMDAVKGSSAVDGGNTTQDRFTVWAPMTAGPVNDGDRVRYKGRLWHVEGDALEWDFPPLAHVQFDMVHGKGVAR